MIGKDEKSVLLRLLVWPFLLSLAADTAVNEAKRVAPALDISDARQDLLRQMLECQSGRERRHFKRGLGGWGWDRVLNAVSKVMFKRTVQQNNFFLENMINTWWGNYMKVNNNRLGIQRSTVILVD